MGTVPTDIGETVSSPCEAPIEFKDTCVAISSEEGPPVVPSFNRLACSSSSSGRSAPQHGPVQLQEAWPRPQTTPFTQLIPTRGSRSLGPSLFPAYVILPPPKSSRACRVKGWSLPYAQCIRPRPGSQSGHGDTSYFSRSHGVTGHFWERSRGHRNISGSGLHNFNKRFLPLYSAFSGYAHL